ncbi:hypothetical protein ACJROX_27370 [Pseudalkalibacillus sp. A8]|uniref:hypothetical protein n=1 Tax=Pseudalkalibacillus sp. A8 TaxID=3382641 RepID=UPI0038B52A83
MVVMTSLRCVFYTTFLLLYIADIFIDHVFVSGSLSVLSITCLIISFWGGGRTYQTISAILLLAGGSLVFVSDVNVWGIPRFFNANALIISLLYVLPFINNLIIVGRYDRSILSLLRVNVRDARQLYVRTSILTYVLCLFIFLSAVPAAYRTVKSLRIDQNIEFINRFASKAILRTFASATVWSPVEVFIAVTVTATQVSYFDMLPWLIVFSIVMLAVDWVTNSKMKRISIDFTHGEVQRMKYQPMFVLFGALFLFISIGYMLSKGFHIDFFDAVILCIVPFSLVWSLLIGRFRSFLTYNYLAWPRHIASMQNFMILFLSIGFFGSMLQETDLIPEAQQALLGGFTTVPLVLFLILQMVSLLAAMIGIHPLVTLSLMGMFIQPLLDTLNPLSLAIVLLTSNLANDSSGTFNTTVTLMSDMTGENPYRITARNLLFALLYGWVGIALAYLLL